MSTCIRLEQEVSMADLFSGRLEKYGIREEITDRTTESDRVLTDGRNYLRVNGEEMVEILTRSGLYNVPGKILGAIVEEFQTDFLTEHEPQFWGYETWDELDAALKEDRRKRQARWYADLVKFLNGDAHAISPGTEEASKAEIAKELIAADPGMIEEERKSESLEAIDSVYRDRRHDPLSDLDSWR